jgi:hypothetical protein
VRIERVIAAPPHESAFLSQIGAERDAYAFAIKQAERLMEAAKKCKDSELQNQLNLMAADWLAQSKGKKAAPTNKGGAT